MISAKKAVAISATSALAFLGAASTATSNSENNPETITIGIGCDSAKLFPEYPMSKLIVPKEVTDYAYSDNRLKEYDKVLSKVVLYAIRGSNYALKSGKQDEIGSESTDGLVTKIDDKSRRWSIFYDNNKIDSVSVDTEESTINISLNPLNVTRVNAGSNQELSISCDGLGLVKLPRIAESPIDKEELLCNAVGDANYCGYITNNVTYIKDFDAGILNALKKYTS